MNFRTGKLKPISSFMSKRLQIGDSIRTEANVLSLPDEILVGIFKLLKRRFVVKCRRACKRFLKITSLILSLEVTITVDGTRLLDRLNSIQTGFSNILISSLHLPFKVELTEELARTFPSSLKRLIVKESTGDPSVFFAHLPLITRITWTDNVDQLNPAITLLSSTLQSLNLGCNVLNPVWKNSLIQLTKVTHLCLPNVPTSFIPYLPTSLASLELHNEVDKKGILTKSGLDALLTRCPNIKNLILRSAVHLEQNYNFFSHLQFLSVDEPSVDVLCCAPYINQLVITNPSIIEDKHLALLTRLEVLKFSTTSESLLHITEEGIRALTTSLTSFSYGGDDIDDHTLFLSMIAKNLPTSIKHLDIQVSTDSAFVEHLNRFPIIHTLLLDSVFDLDLCFPSTLTRLEILELNVNNISFPESLARLNITKNLNNLSCKLLPRNIRDIESTLVDFRTIEDLPLTIRDIDLGETHDAVSSSSYDLVMNLPTSVRRLTAYSPPLDLSRVPTFISTLTLFGEEVFNLGDIPSHVKRLRLEDGRFNRYQYQDLPTTLERLEILNYTSLESVLDVAALNVAHYNFALDS